MEKDELLTTKEIADMLRVSVSWVYAHTGRKGSMPVVRVGKYMRFRYAEVLLWLELEREGINGA
jgi:excisionase family DNA binding protein